MRLTTEQFEIVSNNNTYHVEATKYFNGIEEKRYRVCVNKSPVCVFGWNEDLHLYRLMFDLRNPQMPDGLETAIGKRLSNLESIEKAA